MKLVLIITLMTASLSIFAECAATQSTQERTSGKNLIETSSDEEKGQTESTTAISQ